MNIPSNLKYAESDEWIKAEGNIVTIGLTDYAQDQLSDIVFWESMVDVEEVIEAASVVASLESVKAAGDVISPVSGKIIELNSELDQTPEMVNSDPYGAAWMVKVEMSDPAELDALLDGEAYGKHCEERSE
jgi:glycine cleavage system H protein